MKKRLLGLMLILTMLLCSCGQKETVQNLEFPNTTWNMTMEDVFEVYGLSEKDISYSTEFSKQAAVDNVELFGVKTRKIFFIFSDFSRNDHNPDNNENYILNHVTAVYPDDTDMSPIWKQLKQTYGETIPEYYPFSPSPFKPLDEMRTDSYQETEDVCYWGGNFLTEDIPETESKKYRDLWKTYQTGLNDENWDFFKDHVRTVIVSSAKHETECGKAISWDALNLCVYNELKNQLGNFDPK